MPAITQVFKIDRKKVISIIEREYRIKLKSVTLSSKGVRGELE